MFESLLIANRGEIAVRIARTCRRLGVRTIAIYSEADARALHVAAADEAYLVGPGPASESYLSVEAILQAAQGAGARALHPGYGFLSEDASFAEAVARAGLVWVGPSPDAIRALGDKARARALARSVGVPVLPGYEGEEQSSDELARRAREIGLPLLVKARAGGGGRGLRLVEQTGDLELAVESARREAGASFGDDRVLLERWLPRVRHLEVQLLGDTHGALLALGERECSIQRRHQKLVEESPSPACDERLRTRLYDAAVALGAAVGYSSAGTVEFLLDPDGNFSFLEANTRLQVEHPVTELVTGLDLVELQLRVAAGEALPLRQEDVRLHGHAIEVRLVAEDPLADFRPQAGRLGVFEVPVAQEGVRVDAGFESGTEVPAEYDSLLVKIAVHGGTRDAALARLRQALLATRVSGIRTNLGLLSGLATESDFAAGAFDTAYLARPEVVERLAGVPSEVLAVAAAWVPPAQARDETPWRALGGWRLNRVAQPSTWELADGSIREARVTEDPAHGSRVSVVTGEDQLACERLDQGVSVEGELAGVEVSPSGLFVTWRGRQYRLSRAAERPGGSAGSVAAGDAGGTLCAPMPGRIVKVAVREGDIVSPQQTLVVVEAMKMEHAVHAPAAGRVLRLAAREGDQVPANAPLIELSRTPEEEP